MTLELQVWLKITKFVLVKLNHTTKLWYNYKVTLYSVGIVHNIVSQVGGLLDEWIIQIDNNFIYKLLVRWGLETKRGNNYSKINSLLFCKLILKV